MLPSPGFRAAAFALLSAFGFRSSVFLLLLPLFAHAAAPEASLNLKLAAPIKTWDEAVPLGNGTMGMLLWGEGSTLRLSLDRGDLWDERPSKARLAVQDRFNWAAIQGMVVVVATTSCSLNIDDRWAFYRRTSFRRPPRQYEMKARLKRIFPTRKSAHYRR